MQAEETSKSAELLIALLDGGRLAKFQYVDDVIRAANPRPRHRSSLTYSQTGIVSLPEKHFVQTEPATNG